MRIFNQHWLYLGNNIRHAHTYGSYTVYPQKHSQLGLLFSTASSKSS